MFSQKIYDILIVGAGPSGSAAAITLSKHGHSVLLIDQFSFPREKVCGDGLTGDSLHALKQLGIWEKIESNTYKSSKVELARLSTNKSFILNNPVYMLKRERLDKILLDHAVSSGVEFRQLKFRGKIEQKNGHSICEVLDSKDRQVKIQSKYIIVAAGCQYSRALNKINSIKQKKPDLVAVRGYYKAEWNIEHTLIYFEGRLKNGYYWIFPMGNNEYNIGCGTSVDQKLNLKKCLQEFADKYSEDKNVSGRWLSPIKGAFIRTGLSNLKYASFGNILLAGETLGSTFPFTGEGIGKALETGIMSAEVIHTAISKNDIILLKDYKKRIKRELRKQHRPYRAASFIYNVKFVNTIFFAILTHSNRLCKYASKILGEPQK